MLLVGRKLRCIARILASNFHVLLHRVRGGINEIERHLRSKVMSHANALNFKSIQVRNYPYIKGKSSEHVISLGVKRLVNNEMRHNF